MVENFRISERPDEERQDDLIDETITVDQEADEEQSGESTSKTQLLPILPLRGTIVFPLTVVPLAAGQPRSLRLIDEVVSGNRTVGLVLQKDSNQEAAGPGETYD